MREDLALCGAKENYVLGGGKGIEAASAGEIAKQQYGRRERESGDMGTAQARSSATSVRGFCEAARRPERALSIPGEVTRVGQASRPVRQAAPDRAGASLPRKTRAGAPGGAVEGLGGPHAADRQNLGAGDVSAQHVRSRGQDPRAAVA